MRYGLFIALALSLMVVGCTRGNPVWSWNDADGYYDGWVQIDRPGMGFNHSFYGSLRIYHNSYNARLMDEFGRIYEASWVEYDSWTDRLRIYFRISESYWSPECGNEVYHWEIRMSGRVYHGGNFRGEMQSDIDPMDYYSDHCWMDYNPPPAYIGTFDLDRNYGMYW